MRNLVIVALLVISVVGLVAVSSGETEFVSIILNKESYYVGEPIEVMVKILDEKTMDTIFCEVSNKTNLLYNFSLTANVPYAVNLELDEGGYKMTAYYKNYTTSATFRVIQNETGVSNVTLDVEVDKDTYVSGESIMISGWIVPIIVDEPITLILKKDNETKASVNIMTQTGNFSYAMPADFNENGTYCVFVNYKNVSNSTCFEYNTLHRKSKVNLSIEFEKDTYNVGDKVNGTVRLYTGNVSMDGIVDIYLNNIYLTSVNVSKGIGNFTFTINETEIVVKAVFNGSEMYEGNEAERVIKAIKAFIPLIEIYHSIPEQGEIRIGLPVVWHKTIMVVNRGEAIANYSIDLGLPPDAFNVSVSVVDGT